MPVYCVQGTGRPVGCPVGIHIPFVRWVVADDPDAARLAVYSHWEHLRACTVAPSLLPPHHCVRKGGRRVEFDPENDGAQPWKSYSNGTAGRHFATEQQAMAWVEEVSDMSVDVQEVFNKVIGAGFYGTIDKEYMCHAVEAAREAGVISQDECVVTRQAIDEYMGLIYETGGSMAYALYASLLGNPDGLIPSKWCMLHGVKFYLNWANRPMPQRLHSRPEIHVN